MPKALSWCVAAIFDMGGRSPIGAGSAGKFKQRAAMTTEQIKVWSGDFGRSYTERNRFKSVDDFNGFYAGRYGRGRDEINADWLAGIPKDARILEVGANIGNQLAALQRLGFTQLYGVEIQRYSIEESRKLYSGIDVVLGSGLDIPFKDGWFDLVFTNNVLIHISPVNLPTMLKEIGRVTRRYILGFEYYAPEFTEVHYRGHDDLLWKGDYAQLYRDNNPGLVVEREELMPCLDELGNIDKFFLLRKA
jgi:pseudaminic acid biosynthesis-associated methylase